MNSATRKHRSRALPSARYRPSASSRSWRGPGAPLRNYFLNHGQVAISSLVRLLRSPFSNLMTVAVIGIAVALPAGLHLLVQNLQHLNAGWNGDPSISLFLTPNQDANTTYRLAQRLKAWPEIDELNFISPQQALAELEQQLGLQDLQATLGENPLPGVLIARIAETASDSKSAHQLRTKLQNLPEVDIAQLDLEWLQRFNALTALIERGAMILASLLGVGVILIISNTIRLAVLNRQEEIQVIKLVGGTDAFVRRPFLYTGAWYGLSGGLFACLILSLALEPLAGPIDHLAHLYNSSFTLTGLDIGNGLRLCALTTFLGFGGAYLAVSWHLRAIEPT